MRIATPSSIVVAIGVAAALAGCGSPAPSNSGSTPSASSTQPTSVTSTTPTASSSPASSRCTTTQLSGSLAEANGGGAAGSVYEALVLTNTSSTSCTLQGWPGVSLVGSGNGTQIGAAAQQDRSGEHPTVTLVAGGKATAQLRITQAANYPADTCGITMADGLRVYPPGSKESLFVKASGIQGCSKPIENLLTISALQPAS